jgi:hypothetical protein
LSRSAIGHLRSGRIAAAGASARSIDYSDSFERYERVLTNLEVTFDDRRLARDVDITPPRAP